MWVAETHIEFSSAGALAYFRDRLADLSGQSQPACLHLHSYCLSSFFFFCWAFVLHLCRLFAMRKRGLLFRVTDLCPSFLSSNPVAAHRSGWNAAPIERSPYLPTVDELRQSWEKTFPPSSVPNQLLLFPLHLTPSAFCGWIARSPSFSPRSLACVAVATCWLSCVQRGCLSVVAVL